MSTTRLPLVIEDVEVDVVHKDIKHLYIRVDSPLGTVRATAPQRLEEAQVRLAVTRQLPLTRKHQQLHEVARSTPCELLTGESQDVWGVPYRLEVATQLDRASATLRGDRLHLTVPDGATREMRLRVLQEWQRVELHSRQRCCTQSITDGVAMDESRDCHLLLLA